MRLILLLLGHLWSLPNTVIGLFFGLGGRLSWDRENRVFLIDGGWVAASFGRRYFSGMCIGDVVICSQKLSDNIYRHELVHALQGRLLGPLYLPLTLLGYAWGYIVFPKNGHDASPLEVWADRASGNAASNAYLNNRI
ncbi:hypothetical protein [Armatimonas rosea]|uniref:Uncharacterized protein n=1 Tax=Armatimonas rosea TaxID=685828 RepID=A0A7W9W5Z0_ARMRO|nr:hypothetical protein [Armatimonas rosea]MBB6049037.1 hypothetical protein [Armatimonas rosea]